MSASLSEHAAGTQEQVPQQRPALQAPTAAPEGPRGPLTPLWSWAGSHPAVAVVACLVVSAVLLYTRLSSAPDFNIDEVFYAVAGQFIGAHDSISWGKDPILVHPPIYFMSVAGWLGLTGHLHGGVVPAIHSARVLDATFSLLDILLVGLAAVAWAPRRATTATRGRLLVLAMLLTATNGFVLRFGRVALIEPQALFMSLLALLVAWRLRHARTPVYAGVVGTFIGLAVLTKMPAVFLVAGPLVGALLVRDREGVRRHVLALASGALVWCAFPLWAIINGEGLPFFLQQTNSIDRLLGLLQTSGLNQKKSSPSTAFLNTLLQYVNGYLVFGVGIVALAVATWGVLRQRRLRDEEGLVFLLGLGILSYAFLLYSVFFGQANEQLSVYTVPASVLLALNYRVLVGGSAGRVRRAFAALTAPLGALTLVACVALGAVAWSLYFLPGKDHATQSMESFLNTEIPACAPVNATGDPFHLSATMRTHPVTNYASGPEALAHGVHVFLLSPKDSTFYYGNSNPDLRSWIESNGTRVFFQESHTNWSLSVWTVGTPVTPQGKTLPSCLPPLEPPSKHASAALFPGLLVGTLLLNGLVAGAYARRRTDSGDERLPAPPAA